MTKNALRPAAGARREKLPDLPLPLTMKLAFGALILVIVAALARGIGVSTASSATLRPYLIHLNAHAKTPKKNYGVPNDKQFATDLHTLHSSYVVASLLTAVVVLLLMFGMRKPRSASASRWVLIFALYFTGAIVGLYPPYGLPGWIQGAGVVMGVAALAALVLIFTPPSLAYARACKESTLPPERRGQPRPKLFGPRPAPAPRTTATAARSAAANRTAARPSSAAAGKAKAKARNDAEAVARGAELARTRARASKSRRTDA